MVGRVWERGFGVMRSAEATNCGGEATICWSGMAMASEAEEA
jgi:hypothetical protein